MWPVESIPDPNVLFLRVHDANVLEGKLIPGAFKEHGEGESKGMSTDWSKYCTPVQTRERARTPPKNSVVSMIVGLVRYYNLDVQHAPLPENRAHTNVRGIDENVRARLKLLTIYDWVIKSDHVSSSDGDNFDAARF